MVFSRGDKTFEAVSHIVMILVTLCVILPFILLFVYPEIQTRFMQAELSPEV